MFMNGLNAGNGPNKPFLGTRDKTEYIYLSYAQVQARVLNFGAGLIEVQIFTIMLIYSVEYNQKWKISLEFIQRIALNLLSLKYLSSLLILTILVSSRSLFLCFRTTI